MRIPIEFKERPVCLMRDGETGWVRYWAVHEVSIHGGGAETFINGNYDVRPEKMDAHDIHVRMTADGVIVMIPKDFSGQWSRFPADHPWGNPAIRVSEILVQR